MGLDGTLYDATFVEDADSAVLSAAGTLMDAVFVEEAADINISLGATLALAEGAAPTPALTVTTEFAIIPTATADGAAPAPVVLATQVRTPGGQVWELFSGYDDDGEPIAAFLATGDLAPRGMAVQKRIRKVSLFARAGEDDEEITVNYITDRRNTRTEKVFDLTAPGTDKWDEGEWDTAEWNEPDIRRYRFAPAVSRAEKSMTLRLEIERESETNQMEFYGLAILERERRVD